MNWSELNLSELNTMFNSLVGIIGIGVGVIGWKSLQVANKITNNANNLKDSTVQQAQTMTINNGLDTYAVIKLSQQTTQEELKTMIERINNTDLKISTVQENLDDKPNIHVGPTPPKQRKDNDFWLDKKS